MTLMQIATTSTLAADDLTFSGELAYEHTRSFKDMVNHANAIGYAKFHPIANGRIIIRTRYVKSETTRTDGRSLAMFGLNEKSLSFDGDDAADVIVVRDDAPIDCG
ncbi:MAG: hypothetical protein MZU97_05455 [Bacillus subtilis]|nr:hypothetical protein [Bacillus subtilis]